MTANFICFAPTRPYVSGQMEPVRKNRLQATASHSRPETKKSQQTPPGLLAHFIPQNIRSYFLEGRIRTKDMQTNVHVAVVGRSPYPQIVVVTALSTSGNGRSDLADGGNTHRRLYRITSGKTP